MAKTIGEAQKEASDMESQDAYLTGLAISGNKATVTYSTKTAADIVVAIYDEDSKQMLTSGTATVKAAESTSTATVTIQGSMPKYFTATAYLLDAKTHGPLCDSFTTELYGEALQKLSESTIQDYDKEQVVNFDDDNSTNFAVYADGTKIIENSDNIKVTDHDNGTYTVSDATEDFTSLKQGETFSYTDKDGNILLIKIKNISVSGTTVTITEDKDAELEDFFDVVKMEGGDESLSSSQVSGSARGWKKAIDVGDNKEETKSIKYDKSGEWADGKASGTLSLSGSITVKGYAKVYIAWKEQYVEAKVSSEINAALHLDGKFNVEFSPLSDSITVTICPGLYLSVEPKIVLKFTGFVDNNLTITAAAGFKYDTKTGMKNTSEKPEVIFHIEVEGSLYIGIKPTISVVCLSDKVVNANVSPEFGATFTMSYTKDLTTGQPDSKHSCKACLAGNLSLHLKASVKLSLKRETVFDKELINKTFDNVKKCHYSFDHKEFGWTDCLHTAYKVTVTVKDSAGNPASGVTVNGTKLASVPVTDARGTAIFYLEDGSYQLACAKDNSGKTQSLTVNGKAISVSLQLEKNSGGTEETPSETPSKTPSETPSKTPEETPKATPTYEPDEEDKEDNALVIGNVIASGKCGDNATYEIDDKGVLVISGKGSMMDNYSHPWEDKRSTIKSIYIKKGITSIGENAFRDFISLENVRIPKTITVIKYNAFGNCTTLKTISIPDSVTGIGNNAFCGCTGFTGITLGDGVTRIGNYAFSGCRSLTEISIPGSVSAFGTGAFSGCISLSELIIGDGVTGIGSEAFNGCTSLTGITIPGSVKTVGASAFKGCTSLASVEIQNGVNTLGSYTFYGCTSLEGVSFSGTLSNIGYEAFYKCTSLKSVSIPDSVVEIGNEAFYGCTGMTDVTLGGGVIKIGDSAFSGCKSLTKINIPKNVSTFGSNVFSYCASLSEATVEKGVTDIGKNMFLGCANLESVTLPDGLVAIGAGTFSGCGKLSAISIPGTVTVIGENAFHRCTNLTSVIIPDKVTSIGNYAFYECTGLASVIIPDSMTYIGDQAFLGCKSFTKISIPGNISAFGKDVFLNCTSLSEATVETGVTGTGKNMFWGCANLESVTLPDGLATIGAGTFSGCNKLSVISIPETVTVIGDNAFDHCTSLASVSIPDKVTDIGDYAFSDCKRLKSVSIPDSVTKIGDNAFSSCISLASINIPDGVNILESWVFASCTSLESISLPATLLRIESGVFYNCTSLPTVQYGGSAEDWKLIDKYYDAYLNNVKIVYNSSRSLTPAKMRNKMAAQARAAAMTRMVSFQNLNPKKLYVFVAVKEQDGTHLLDADNLLYITQGYAKADGSLTFDYIPRTDDDALLAAYKYESSGEAVKVEGTDNGVVVASPSPSAKPSQTPKPSPSVKPIQTSKPDPSAKPSQTPSPTVKPSQTLRPIPSVIPIQTPRPIPSEEPSWTPRPTSNKNNLAKAKAAFKKKSTKIKRIKNKKKKQVTVQWKKVSGANGYQIQYSLKQSMKKAKKASVKKGKTVVRKLSKLKSKKTYYVRVRAYKKIGGKTIYSKWSGKRHVRVK